MKTKNKKLGVLRHFRNNLEDFSAKCLKIKTKASKVAPARIIPFIFNSAQKYTHARLEQQLRKQGFVRALILKGRQQGISTYVAARYYHKATLWSAVNVYILTHEQKASDSLFGMVDRYHDHNPIRPSVGINNAKEMLFDKLDGSYIVATAGQKAGGRSRTSSLFHGSEVGFWTNAPDHFASSVQTIPDAPETEIILESTANGPYGEFYERWQSAEAGESDYIAIFVPWFWQSEYYREPEKGFVLDATPIEGELTEEEYAELFKLNDGQMCWRRHKRLELRDPKLFDQEYPATAAMAFVNSNADSYIDALPVLRARKREGVVPGGPLIMGADPAGPGGDRFAICGRRGLAMTYLKWRNKIGTADAFHWCKDIILEHKPARFFVDAGGIGAAVLSLLKNDEDIPKGVVRGVNFGSPSQAKRAKPDKPGPKNRRSEMWQRSKQWLSNDDELCSVFDIDKLQADATAPQLKRNLTNDILLEGKEDMRARGVRSPDLWDAFVLTFASLSHISNYHEDKNPINYGNVEARARRAKETRQTFAQPEGSGSNGWMG